MILNRRIEHTVPESLTGKPDQDIKSYPVIPRTLERRNRGVDLPPWPTCEHPTIHPCEPAEHDDSMYADSPLGINVALLGCLAHGPEGAKYPHLRIDRGITYELLIRDGEIGKRVEDNELLETLTA